MTSKKQLLKGVVITRCSSLILVVGMKVDKETSSKYLKKLIGLFLVIAGLVTSQLLFLNMGNSKISSEMVQLEKEIREDGTIAQDRLLPMTNKMTIETHKEMMHEEMLLKASTVATIEQVKTKKDLKGANQVQAESQGKSHTLTETNRKKVMTPNEDQKATVTITKVEVGIAEATLGIEGTTGDISADMSRVSKV